MSIISIINLRLLFTATAALLRSSEPPGSFSGFSDYKNYGVIWCDYVQELSKVPSQSGVDLNRNKRTAFYRYPDNPEDCSIPRVDTG